MNFLKGLFTVSTKSVTDTSPSGELNSTDWHKTVRDFFLVSGAAGIGYLLEHVAGLDFWGYGTMIVPVVSMFLNVVLKWLKDNQA